MAAQKRERSKRELTCADSQGSDSGRNPADANARNRKQREQRVIEADIVSKSIRKPRQDRVGQDSVNVNIREKDYIAERLKPDLPDSHNNPLTPKLSRRSSLRYNPKYDNLSDIYTHIEEELEEDIKPGEDFNRSLLIAQSAKSTRRKTNSVRFKLDLDDISDEGIGEGSDWRRRKQYADSIVSDTDQSMTSSRGIIRNAGCLSDRTGYRTKELEFIEMEHAGNKTWRASHVDDNKTGEGLNDELDVIDISKSDNSLILNDVTYPSHEERDKLQSASKARRRLLQEKRRSRSDFNQVDSTCLSGEESDWVTLPSLVFREDSDVAPPRVRRGNSGRRRRRKRRSERAMEKQGIEKVLSNMSEEAKLAIDAILAEMEEEKGTDYRPRTDYEYRDLKHQSYRENSGKFTAMDDGMDSGFQDTDTSNNLNSRSSGSEEYQRVRTSDKGRSRDDTNERSGDDSGNAQSSSRYRSKTARSRTPTKLPLIRTELDPYNFDDSFTESSMPSRQNIPGLGTYKFPRMREKTFKITPQGYDSRYADMPRYEAPPGEESDPTITAKAKEKCNQWLDQQYLPSLS